MKAVLDTNVIVSGLWSPNGNPAAILAYLRRQEFDVVVSDELAAELQDVLGRRHILGHLRWTSNDAVRFALGYVASAIYVVPTFSIGILADESDNRLLEAASASEADYLVSGDKKVVALGAFARTEIVTPAQLVRILSQNRQLL